MASYTYWEPPLAVGGEKIVYRGRCDQSGEAVVVKFLRTPYGPLERQHFSLEIRRARAAQGSGVARFIDSNDDWNPPFLVEEYFPEGNLATRMAQVFAGGEVYTVSFALGWARQILTHLGGLHGRSIIHRDVKPANIVIRRANLTLIDMGVGRTLARPTFLQTRAFVGTHGYASPEQELAQGRVDHRSDIYAVGVILHELLTARRGSYANNSYRGNQAVSALLSSLLAFLPTSRPATCGHAIATVDWILGASRSA